MTIYDSIHIHEFKTRVFHEAAPSWNNQNEVLNRYLITSSMLSVFSPVHKNKTLTIIDKQLHLM